MAGNHKKLQKQLIALKKFQEVAKAIRFVAGGEIGLLRKEIKCRFLALSSIAPIFNPKYYSGTAQSYLVVPITDDRGSCGSHNTSVIVATQELVGYLEEQQKTISIYTIGKKAKVFFKKIYKNYIVGFALNIRDVKFSIDACYFITQKFLSYKFNRCCLVFNRYFSIQMQKALAYTVGSLEDISNTIQTRANADEKANIFFKSIQKKNSHKDFIRDLYFFGFSLLLADALEDNKYSFLAGRFNGMDNIIKSTTDLIDALTIKYNKARQDYITTELIEIISCKEAIMSTNQDRVNVNSLISDLILNANQLLVYQLVNDFSDHIAEDIVTDLQVLSDN